MSSVKRLSENHPEACLLILPDKETNLYWIQQEMDSLEVSEAKDEEEAFTMIRMNSRFGDMPRAMHFDFAITADVFTKLLDAPAFGLRWFVSGLSSGNIEDIQKRVPNYDRDVLVVNESVRG